MSETVRDIINNLKNNDNVAAGKSFNTAMQDKMSAALDAKKIQVASNMVTKTVEEPVDEPVTEVQEEEETQLNSEEE
tara:strand:- start:525 stop:755 length:231 start_codon:yes stop_codon:yes gene_type:complete